MPENLSIHILTSQDLADGGTPGTVDFQQSHLLLILVHFAMQNYFLIPLWVNSLDQILSLRTTSVTTSIFLLTFFGCGSTFQNINFLTDAEEVALGQDFSREVEKEITLYKDPFVVNYINEFGETLVRYCKRPNIRYYIKIVDTDDVNAFALPGGYLYINRGLISLVETESELAGVIAHEIGHVVGRHGAKSLSRQFGLEVITRLISGANPGGIRQLVSRLASIGNLLGMFHYSREAEREADALAVENLVDAGYDPDGIAVFFEKLLEMKDREPGSLTLLFSTHPPSRERIENTRHLISSLSLKTGLTTDSEQFHRAKDRLPPIKNRL